MERQVTFKCSDCYHYNRQALGTVGYDFKQYTFEALSEVFAHMLAEPHHYIIAVVDDGQE